MVTSEKEDINWESLTNWHWVPKEEQDGDSVAAQYITQFDADSISDLSSRRTPHARLTVIDEPNNDYYTLHLEEADSTYKSKLTIDISDKEETISVIETVSEMYDGDDCSELNGWVEQRIVDRQKSFAETFGFKIESVTVDSDFTLEILIDGEIGETERAVLESYVLDSTVDAVIYDEKPLLQIKGRGPILL